MRPDIYQLFITFEKYACNVYVSRVKLHEIFEKWAVMTLPGTTNDRHE